jgi:hypothetical protein
MSMTGGGGQGGGGLLSGLFGMLTGSGGPLGLAGAGLDKLGAGDWLTNNGMGGAADFLFGRHTPSPGPVTNTTMAQPNGTVSPDGVQGMSPQPISLQQPPGAAGPRQAGLLANLDPAILSSVGRSMAGGGAGPPAPTGQPANPSAEVNKLLLQRWMNGGR